MKTFEEVKQILLDKAKEAGACQTGYKMGLNSENKLDLLKAITENWRWVFVSVKMIDAKFLDENFTSEELKEAGIYTSGKSEVETVAFACGFATVKAYDSATVEAYDSATVEAYDSATVKAYDSATVEAYDSATVKAYDSATVETYGFATVEAHDNSYVEDCTGNLKSVSDNAIVKDYYGKKIYIKKGAFEIIEVE